MTFPDDDLVLLLLQVMAEHKKAKEFLKSLVNDAEAVNTLQQEAQRRLDEKAEELKVIHKSYEKMKKEMAALKSADVDMTNQLDEISRAAKDMQHTEAQAAKKLSELEKIRERIIGTDESGVFLFFFFFFFFFVRCFLYRLAAVDGREAPKSLSEEELAELDVATLQAEIEVLEQNKNKCVR